jgi:hypothetical protein
VAFNHPRTAFTLLGMPPSNIFTYGVWVLTYIGRDVLTNDTANCSFTVTVVDPRLPSITCPPNMYRPLANPFLAATVVSYPGPKVPESLVPQLVSGPANNSYFPVGVTTVTFSVTNLEWYTAYCSFNITVTPTNSLICPSNITVSGSLLPNATGAYVNYTVPATLDGVPAILITGFRPGALFPFGNTTVTYQVCLFCFGF